VGKNERYKSSRKGARDTVFIGLFVVLISVCAWIVVPYVVPFTMQTFAVFFAFSYLGGLRGSIAVFGYLVLGLIGIPVFAGGTCGIGVILGQTGGYMIGWVVSGIIIWIFEKPLKNSLKGQVALMLVGLLVCYIIGTTWFVFAYARQVKEIGWWTATVWCVLPFIVPDVIKILLATTLSRRIKKLYPSTL